ncbi:hypothetical protein A2Z67_01545 [Candidatus Woesebacteria bacterium RBG_13_36_22]|uniref:Uncharacterized protein n=1 Tax=Candidatus Woesebacteria bacterium RBG_13_36_22 TaxID=1802478 RepID=A0A1F7X0Z9_9BACT|nr:MAG: hypothetical protein A2Z67_01545 [Candidatus Woesebacteria bacterium RBG_13_36_22]
MEFNSKQNLRNQNPMKPSQEPVMKKFSTKPLAKNNISLVFGTVVVIFAGIVTGWFLSGQSFAGGKAGKVIENSGGVVVSETEAGLEDESNLPDSAEGVLVEGGIEGEGTYHLDRGTGASKYVYLTSSVFDLQSFVGKKVKVWGETLSGLHAGWLMDVGKIKVID